MPTPAGLGPAEPGAAAARVLQIREAAARDEPAGEGARPAEQRLPRRQPGGGLAQHAGSHLSCAGAGLQVFDYFASGRDPNGVVYMLPGDMMRSVVPVYPPEGSDYVRSGSLAGEPDAGAPEEVGGGGLMWVTGWMWGPVGQCGSVKSGSVHAQGWQQRLEQSSVGGCGGWPRHQWLERAGAPGRRCMRSGSLVDGAGVFRCSWLGAHSWQWHCAAPASVREGLLPRSALCPVPLCFLYAALLPHPHHLPLSSPP